MNKQNILVIGCGGIGCELVKLLSSMDHHRLTFVDLDRIELSNLNRQFFFTFSDIKKYKAEVIADKYKKQHKNAEVEFKTENINKFDIGFFRQFDFVYNCLDNNEARSYVNLRCVFAEIPFVDGGSTGFLGQSLYFDGNSECFDCVKRENIKSVPVCTIRTLPTEFLHCVIWAKEYFLQGLKKMKEENTTVDCNNMIGNENESISIENNIDNVGNNINKDNNSVSTSENSINKKENSINGIENSVSDVENSINKEENSISGVVNFINKKDNSISCIGKCIYNAENDISNIRNNINNIENNKAISLDIINNEEDVNICDNNIKFININGNGSNSREINDYKKNIADDYNKSINTDENPSSDRKVVRENELKIEFENYDEECSKINLGGVNAIEYINADKEYSNNKEQCENNKRIKIVTEFEEERKNDKILENKLPCADKVEIKKNNFTDSDLFKEMQKEGKEIFNDDVMKLIEIVEKSLKRDEIKFDKDDIEIMELVYVCAKIRAISYGIEIKSLFETKQIAGNIIPSLCTTNSIVASLMVKSAIKKTNFYISNSKKGLIELGVADKNLDCYVCGKRKYIFMTNYKILLKDAVSFFCKIVGQVKLIYNENLIVYNKLNGSIEDNEEFLVLNNECFFVETKKETFLFYNYMKEGVDLKLIEII